MSRIRRPADRQRGAETETPDLNDAARSCLCRPGAIFASLSPVLRGMRREGQLASLRVALCFGATLPGRCSRRSRNAPEAAASALDKYVAAVNCATPRASATSTPRTTSNTRPQPRRARRREISAPSLRACRTSRRGSGTASSGTTRIVARGLRRRTPSRCRGSRQTGRRQAPSTSARRNGSADTGTWSTMRDAGNSARRYEDACAEGKTLKDHLDMIVLAALASGPAHGYALIGETAGRGGRASTCRTIYRRCTGSSRPPVIGRWVTAESGGAARLRVDPARQPRARRTPRGVAAILRCHRRTA